MRTFGWCACVVCLAGLATAEAEYVGRDELVTNFVAAGSVKAQSSPLFVSDGAQLIKTGGGTWEVPTGAIRQRYAAPLSVSEGTLRISASEQPTDGAEALSDAIKAKIGLWLDASVASSFSYEDDGVSVRRWSDARETNPSSPSYPYAVTTNRWPASPKYPTVREIEGGRKSVYFGGKVGAGAETAGAYMMLRTAAGKDHSSRLTYDVFFVHAVSNKWNCIWGSNSGSGSTFSRDDVADVGSAVYLWNHLWSDTFNADAWLDGERINPVTEKVRPGVHLLEVAMPRWSALKAWGVTLFRNYGGTVGGEDLNEGIWFSERLTDVERMQVENYLMRKWQIGAAGRVLAKTDGGSTLEVKVDESDSALDDGVRLEGFGAVAKTGAGDWNYRNRDDFDFGGAVSVGAGRIVMGTQLPVMATAGQRMTSTNSAARVGAVVSVSDDAAADAFVKDGNDELTLAGWPVGAKKLTVSGGNLNLRPAATNRLFVSDVGVEVAIANSGFEETAGTAFAAFTNSRLNGWNHTGGGICGVYDFDAWTASGKGIEGVAISTYNHNTARPHGKCAVSVRHMSSANPEAVHLWTEVDIPSPGEYELGVYVYGRDHNSQKGGSAFVSLTNATTGACAPFGSLMYTASAQFTLYRLRAQVKEGGKQRLDFQIRPYDTHIVFDDISLKKVGGLRTGYYPIPGGDFEHTTYLKSGYSMLQKLTNGLVTAGWDFGADGAAADPKVGVVTPLTVGYYSDNSYGGRWNGTRYPYGGAFALYFKAAASVSTEPFVPPVGQFYLQANIAQNHSSAKTLAATLEIGDKTIDLGTVKTVGRNYNLLTWPKEVELDGETPVVLRLTYDGSGEGLWADDFAFVAEPSANELELVTNPKMLSAFSASNWQGYRPAEAFYDSPYYRRPYSEGQWAFGTDTVNGGGYHVELMDLGGIWQTVTIPAAGRYRLCWFDHYRLNVKASTDWYQPNPVRALLVREGVTNVIGVATCQSWMYVRHVFDFDVDKAGDYRLILQGTSPHVSADSGNSPEVTVGAVSLKKIDDKVADTPDMGEDAEIRVKTGSKLGLLFRGTNKVSRILLGGRGRHGVVNAQTDPDFIYGQGSLYADQRGSMMIVR